MPLWRPRTPKDLIYFSPRSRCMSCNGVSRCWRPIVGYTKPWTTSIRFSFGRTDANRLCLQLIVASPVIVLRIGITCIGNYLGWSGQCLALSTTNRNSPDPDWRRRFLHRRSADAGAFPDVFLPEEHSSSPMKAESAI